MGSQCLSCSASGGVALGGVAAASAIMASSC